MKTATLSFTPIKPLQTAAKTVVRHRLAALLAVTALACACTGSRPQPDERLNAVADSIFDCLNDPAGYSMADSMLRRAMATPGAEQAEAWPMLIYHQGVLRIYQGDMTAAKSSFQRLYAMLPVEVQPDFVVSVPQSLAVIYRREGQTDSAFYYYDRALEGAIGLGAPDWLGAVYTNIGVLHHTIGHYAEAERYLDKAAGYAHESDDGYTLMCVQQVRASNKLMLKKTAEAQACISEAWELAAGTGSADWQVRCLSTMVSLCDELQQSDSASHYIEMGSALLEALPSGGVTAVGFLTARANHSYNEQQWEKAVADYSQLFSASGSGTREPDVMERMARSLAALGRWHEAYCYMDSTQVRRDSLSTRQMTERKAEFDAKFRTMEKDLQIARLNMQRLWLAALLVLLLLAAAALWLWQGNRRQRREAAMRISGMEDERRRLAKELHDGLCNDILALELQCRDAAGTDSLHGGLSRLRHQVRLLSHQLMPPEFTHLSISQLLQDLAENIRRTAKMDVGCQTAPDDDDTWRRLPPKVAYELYRIVQEHTANIVKGATATQIHIVLTQLADESYRLSITDDGQRRQAGGQGIGAKTIHDRALSLKAQESFTADNHKNCLQLDFKV